MLEKICSLIILKMASTKTVESSFQFRNILLNSLGIIEDESFIIRKLKDQGFIIHEGLFENSNFYKSVTTTEEGLEYLKIERKNVVIPQEEFSKERVILLKKILEI